ncbi:hypothetical protein QEW_2355 [Clostridioides difficile CD160]|nr:hypothetical protein QEW_2355 [Clostridioides difficile CD160]
MTVVDNLHLDIYIRNNFIDISKFVGDLLDCNKEKAKEKLFIFLKLHFYT